jgi:2-keto-3-deoxy-L-rhamnonate aldolase RhmA
VSAHAKIVPSVASSWLRVGAERAVSGNVIPERPGCLDITVGEAIRRRLLASRTPSFGTWISSPSVVAVDALKGLGFEWFMIDTEHAQINPETVAAMVATLGSDGPAPFVRVGAVDQYLVKQALDAGARGVLVPLVGTEAQARAALSFAKYPPDGVRGAGPTAPSKYGRELGAYLRSANTETLVGVQIETAEALANLDAIAGVPGVDLLFVGRQDLTLSLGLLDDRKNPRVEAAMRAVVEACERNGKVPGTLAIDPNEKRLAVDLGYRFVALGSDVRFMLQGARAYLAD